MMHRHNIMSRVFTANVRRRTLRASLFALVVLVLCDMATAGTYYVGPTATGNGSGGSRTNLKSISGFKTAAQPGDVALLQPGNYGSFAVDGGYGASGKNVIYCADSSAPGYMPRSADWYTDYMTRPTAGNYPCFSTIEVKSRIADDGSAAGQYISFENIAVLAGGGRWSYGILGRPYVAHMIFRNISIFGPDIPHEKANEHLSYDFLAEGIRLHCDGGASDWHDVMFDSCYVEGAVQPVIAQCAVGDNVEFRDCRFGWMFYGLFVNVTGQQIKFTRCNIGGSPDRTIGDSANSQGSRKVASAGSPANATFKYSGADPSFIDAIHDHVKVTHGAVSEVRPLSVFDAGTNTVAVSPPFSFNVAAGDTVEFFESCHGATISIMQGNVWLDGCIIHDAGNSGMVYTYGEWANNKSNITIENCLIYGARWNGHPCIDFGVGQPQVDAGLYSNTIIRNNTLVGVIPDEGQITGANSTRNYGMAMRIVIRNGADVGSIVIANNLCVGTVSLTNGAAANVRNNVVYYSNGGFETDATGPNANNKIVRVQGSNEIPFNSGWFVGGEGFSDAFKATGGHRMFREEFKLAKQPLCIGTGSSTAGDYSATDLAGNLRKGSPDVGCYAYAAEDDGSESRFLWLNSVGDQVVTVGEELSIVLTANDPNGDAVTFSAKGAPQGARLDGSTFVWTPTAQQVGDYLVTFTVTDGKALDSKTVKITVSRPNAAPILGSVGNKSTNENQALTFAVGATDADSDSLTYSAAGLPSGASFSGQTFAWTPSFTQAGTYNVTFTVSDGKVQDSETITISVANVNRAPALTAIGDRSIDEDDTLALALSGADPDGSGLTYSATGLPSGATLSGQNFSWTPTADQVGSHEITFVVSDGSLNDSETITVTVVGAAADTVAPVVARQSPAPGSIQVPLNNLLRLHVTDAGRGVDAASVTITLDDQIIYQGNTPLYTSPLGRCIRSGSKTDYEFIYQNNELFDFDHEILVTVNASDIAGNVMSQAAYSFATEMRAFGSNRCVSEAGAAAKGGPVTVADAAGNIWAAWHAGPVGARDVFVARLPAGQDTFDTPVQVTTHSLDQCNPDLALAANGTLYVVWQDNRGGDWDIYASVSTNGRTFSKETVVIDANDNQTAPSIVVDGASPSRVYVAWQDDRNGNQDIYVASSTNAFASSTVSRVTTNAADQTEPDMAVGASNTVYLVWTDRRSGQADIYGAASNASWSNVALVAGEGNQTSPALAVPAGSSILHLLWVNSVSGDSDIYYASSNGLPASPLTGENIIDDTTGAPQTAPSLACDAGGGVFACWQDTRNVGAYGSDTDVYFTELGDGAVRTNILVGETGAKAGQSEPAIALSEDGQPYIVWTDSRDMSTEIYCAATTYLDSTPLYAGVINSSTGATIGTASTAITKASDVSVVVPAGACQSNLRVTISKILNPVVSPVDCLGSYDFGPSGIEFSQPVTVTIPYQVATANRRARAYWYNSLTGALSQQGITDIENIAISNNLYALRFKTTHFTPYYLVASDSEIAASGSDGGGGGCSMSAKGDGSPKHLLIPIGAVVIIMAVLRRKDKKAVAE